MYLWRAVDAEGEVFDVLVQPKRDKRAAQTLMRKLLKKQGMAPDARVTDKCPSYGAALRELNLNRAAHLQHKRANNRAESSHVPVRRRERKQQQGFRVTGLSPAVLLDARGHVQHLHGSPVTSSRLLRTGSCEPRRSKPGGRLRAWLPNMSHRESHRRLA